jgi:hypothetical protein
MPYNAHLSKIALLTAPGIGAKVNMCAMVYSEWRVTAASHLHFSTHLFELSAELVHLALCTAAATATAAHTAHASCSATAAAASLIVCVAVLAVH